MRRLVLLFGMVVAMVLVGLAAASPPGRYAGTYTDSFTLPAGTFCDFEYSQVFTLTFKVTVFSDGREEHHGNLQWNLTNNATGYTLTETARVNATFSAEDIKWVGVTGKFRDPNGKIVDVHAGRIVYDPLAWPRKPLRFTPNSGAGTLTSETGDPPASVICPALGGNPA